MSAVTQRILTRITAHQAACKAGILHGDLSPGNIMLVDSETNIKDGMLIDWDLSKVIDPQDKPGAVRQFTRTVSKVSEAVAYVSPKFLTCLATKEHGCSWQRTSFGIPKSPKPWDTTLNTISGCFSGSVYHI